MSQIRRKYRSRVPVPAEELQDWHQRRGAFERLTPPWAETRIVASQGSTGPGDWKQLQVKAAGPITFSWTLKHQPGDSHFGFTDVQESGPFKSWSHIHRFLPESESTSILEDEIVYELPYGKIIQEVFDTRVSAELDRLFQLRHSRTCNDLERQSAVGIPGSIRIAVTGSTGLVGQRLVPFLRTAGHEVQRLVRSAPQAPDEIFWNPDEGRIDAQSLEGVDAVIHLAGVSLAGKRWSEERKALIRSSRIGGTQLLSKTLASLRAKPAVLVSTSAVGFYGNSGDTVLTEASPRGEGFLAEVCEAWERATEPAAEAGIRVVHPRFGVVIAAEGGMLPLISKAFKVGVGGPIGNGKQYLSWISLDDLLGVLLESVANRNLKGAVNAVAPNPIKNREFAQTLGDELHRPSVLRAPEFAVKLAAGQMAEELMLFSQRVEPSILEREGFKFILPTFAETLRYERGHDLASQAASLVAQTTATNVHAPA